MEGLPGFGVRLARYLDHRRLDVVAVCRTAGVPETELRAVLDGAAPNPSLLRRLAPALRLHTADLFVIAELPVPDDLAPLDSNAINLVDDLAWEAMRVPPEQRRRLRELVRSLPQEERGRSAPPLRVYEQYPPGPGAVLVRMLRNRNLRWTGSVQILARMTAGRVYLSASTIGMVGHGRKELYPELLAGFAAVLGIPVGDLATLAGIEPPDDIPPVDPGTVEVAELIWDVRRLTAEQLRQVCEHAESLRHD